LLRFNVDVIPFLDKFPVHLLVLFDLHVDVGRNPILWVEAVHAVNQAHGGLHRVGVGWVVQAVDSVARLTVVSHATRIS
jgi:hypothetical protein